MCNTYMCNPFRDTSRMNMVAKMLSMFLVGKITSAKTLIFFNILLLVNFYNWVLFLIPHFNIYNF